MQLTLVAFYGAKPAGFLDWIQRWQNVLAEGLQDAFQPYAIEQVHGTIVGLEGMRTERGIANVNFQRVREGEVLMDLPGVLEFLRRDWNPIRVRAGGFRSAVDYGFSSQGRHPFLRSFSIQGEIAVAMGWPFHNDTAVPRLDSLRRRFQQFGILHKWHRTETDFDNDFFFVLGRTKGCSPDTARRTEDRLRQQIAEEEPLWLDITAESLSFVAYEDPQLPPARCIAWPVSDLATTPERLADVWPST